MGFTFVRHDTYDGVFKLDDITCRKALQEAHALINLGMKVDRYFDEYEASDKSSSCVYDLLDNLDGVTKCSIGNLEDYSSACASLKSDAVNKSIPLALQAYNRVFRKTGRIVEKCVAPSDDAIVEIRESTKYLVGCMSYFCCYEFSLYGLPNADLATDPEIDCVFMDYCKEISADPQKLAEELCDISIVYRVSFGVFTDHPELENSFMEIVGPEINIIDEKALTLDMVKQVIAGDMDVEELMTHVSLFRETEEDDVRPADSF